MALTDSQIVDLVTTTLKELGRMRWTDIASQLQNYEVLPRILQKEKVSFTTGEGIQRNVMLTTSGAAKNTGLYAVDDTNVGDVMGVFSVPFRHTTTNWSFDRREKEINGGPEQIVDLIRVRRSDAMISLAALLEANFFATTVVNDNLTPFGLAYWVVRNTAAGFNGGNPTNFPAGAGNLSSSTYPRWSNYTDQYVSVSKADLIYKMRNAHRLTNFKSPVDVPDYRTGRGQNWRIYMNNATMEAMETLGEQQNENLGRDLAPYDGGEMTFRRHPLIYVPQLDADSTNPIYMLDWSSFEVFFLKGEYLRETGPFPKYGIQHTVFTAHVDLSWNTLCTNRRNQAIITL